MPLDPKTKKEVIDRLIANEGVPCDNCGAWTEEDRNALNAIPEEKLMALDELRKIAANSSSPVEEEDSPEEAEDEPETTQNAAPTPKTDQEWLAQAPPTIRSVVQEAIKFQNARKAQLISTITANERNRFTKQYLDSCTPEVLEGLASLAQNEASEQPGVLLPHYSGIPVSRLPVMNESFGREDLDMAEYE